MSRSTAKREARAEAIGGARGATRAASARRDSRSGAFATRRRCALWVCADSGKSPSEGGTCFNNLFQSSEWEDLRKYRQRDGCWYGYKGDFDEDDNEMTLPDWAEAWLAGAIRY